MRYTFFILFISILYGFVDGYQPADVPEVLRESEWNLNINFGPKQGCEYTPFYFTNSGESYGEYPTVKEHVCGFGIEGPILCNATMSEFAGYYFGSPRPTGLFNYQNTITAGWSSSIIGGASPSECTVDPHLPAFNSSLHIPSSNSFTVNVTPGHLYAVTIRLKELPYPSFRMKVNFQNNVGTCPPPIYGEPFVTFCTIAYATNISGTITISASNSYDSYDIVTLTLSDLTLLPLSLADFTKNRLNGKLSGKTAVVTGSSRGVGRQTGFLMASFDAEMIFNFQFREDKATEIVQIVNLMGGKAKAIQADVRNPNHAATLLDGAQNIYGSPATIVVINAGHIVSYYPWANPLALDPAYAARVEERVGGTIQEGTKYMLKELLPRWLAMPNPTRRRLIVVNSDSSRRSTQGGCPPYTAAKSGQLGWFKEFVATFNMANVNTTTLTPAYTDFSAQAVCPDLILTDLARSYAFDFVEPPFGNVQNAQEFEFIVSLIQQRVTIFAGDFLTPQTLAIQLADMAGPGYEFNNGNIIQVSPAWEVMANA